MVVLELNMADTGRPPYSDSDYQGWLDEMAPYLKQGHSLNYAIFHAKLDTHETTIREKYRLNDWFSRKVDSFQSYLGELINNVFFNEVAEAVEAQKQGRQLSDEQWRNMRFMAEKHRSSTRYFVSRQEIATKQSDKQDIAQLLDILDGGDSIDDVAETYAKELQVSAVPTPILTTT